jgi:hypothetical protein
MADNSTPNYAANMEKAEGDRDTAQPERRDEVNPSERYGNDRGEHAGGITNRPLDEEIENQEALPERGKREKDERTGEER